MLQPDEEEGAVRADDGGTPSSPASLPPLPSPQATLGREKLKARLFYLGSNAFVVATLLALPDRTIFHRKADRVATMLVAVATSIAFYLVLQGSDPGYLDRETAASVVASQQHAQQLPMDEEEDNEEEDEEIGGRNGQARSPAAWGAAAAARAVATAGIAGPRAIEMVERVAANEDRASLLPTTAAVASSSSSSRLRPPREGGGGHTKRGRQRRRADQDGYCRRCDMAKPMRSHHCRYCNRCVATFDHHCTCIGTCVGERNQCRFFWFLLAQNAAVLAALDVARTAYDSRPPSFTDWALANLLPLSVSLLLWGMEAFAFLMLAVHTFLALAGLTSFECAKGPERVWYLRGTRDCDLPFSQGCVANLRAFCCLRDGVWTALVGRAWAPAAWARDPRPVVRDSTDICEHPWENRYWRCC